MLLFLLISCGVSATVRRGDEAYAAGDYAAALSIYEGEAGRRTPNKALADRLEKTRSALRAERIAAADAQYAGGAFRAGIAASQAVVALGAHPDAVAHVGRAWELVGGEGARLVAEARPGAAFTLSEQFAMSLSHAPAAEAATAQRTQWVEALATRLVAADAAKHGYLSAFIAATLASLGAVPVQTAQKAWTQALAKDRFGISLTGDKAVRGALTEVAKQYRDPRLEVRDGKVAGFKPDITVHVRAAKFEKRITVADSTEEIEVKSGNEALPNPRYIEQKAQVDAQRAELEGLRKQLEEARASAASDQAACSGSETPVIQCDTAASRTAEASRLGEQVAAREAEVQNAEENLGAIPPTVVQPTYGVRTVPIQTHNIEIVSPMQVRVKIGKTGYDEQRSATAVISDRTHQGLPDLGVPPDPLDVPTNGAMEEALQPSVVSALSSIVAEAFEKKRAARLASATAPKNRANELAFYIAMDPSRVDPSIRDEFERIVDIPDAIGLASAMILGQLPFDFASRTSPVIVAEATGTKPVEAVSDKPVVPGREFPIAPVRFVLDGKPTIELTKGGEVLAGDRILLRVVGSTILTANGQVAIRWQKTGEIVNAAGQVVGMLSAGRYVATGITFSIKGNQILVEGQGKQETSKETLVPRPPKNASDLHVLLAATLYPRLHWNR